MNEMMTEQENQHQAFDQATRAYVSTDAQENIHREQNALRLDTENNSDISTFTPRQPV